MGAACALTVTRHSRDGCRGSCGGTFVWLAERHHPESNLKRWADSLWWAVTTLSTVGYGDHTPVTIWGRLVAVVMMACGVAIIGAVAAVVAFAFASRLAARLEAAVHHMETQAGHVEAEMENVSERVGRPSTRASTGLRELVIGVADSQTAASLTWLLARLGWHPEAGDHGVSWRDGGVVLRVAVRPWDMPFGVQGRLTFGAGSPTRLARIAREATRHGFHNLALRPEGRLTRAPTAEAGAHAHGQWGSPQWDGGVAASRRADDLVVRPDRGADDPDQGSPVTLRTVSGFEVVLVSS